MTRYFYTDPLAAAWMAKRFGMIFQCQYAVQHGLPDRMYETAFVEWEWGEHIISFSRERVYIHPDSLSLLEPQDGDVLVWEHDGYVHADPPGVTPMKTRGLGIFPILRTDAVHGGRFSFRIIQRNGLPFHWPEQEAA